MNTVLKLTPILSLTLFLSLASVGASEALAENTSGVPIPAEPNFKKKNAATYGKQIATYIDLADSGWVDAYAKSTITIINARGEKNSSKTTQLTLEGSGGNKALVRYMSPASVRGVAALTHEKHTATDDSWLYLPSSRRVRRISGANRTASFQGTEFTYEDLTTFVPSRYKWKFLSESKKGGEPILKVEAVPTYKNSGYSKLNFHINGKQWRAEKIEFYDKGGRLQKTLNFSKWKLFHGRYWRPQKLDMKNAQTQKRSTVVISTQFVNISKYDKKDGSARAGLKATAFTRRALETR
jgi:hypothetical protein